MKLPPHNAAAPREHGRLADRLGSAAFLLLLVCLTTRPFLSETFFRSSAIPGSFAASPAQGPIAKDSTPPQPNRMELARVTFAVGILLAAGLWLLSGAAVGEIRIRYPRLSALVMLFVALSLASAMNASDKRCALDSWIEQASLLIAALLAAQLCADRRRFLTVLVVLAAVGGALAAKGLYQKFVEAPQLIAAFEQDRASSLAARGIADGSPQATALAARVYDPSVTGYVGLANVFVATMLICAMAAAGLAAWKIAAARKSLPRFRQVAKKGEIHLPSLAAAVSALLAAMAGVVLLLTRSTGGVAAFILALPACALAYRFRDALSRRRKKYLLAFGVMLLAGMAAVTVVGLTCDGSANMGHARKTMLFRWLYWDASAQIVRDHPLLGVGPANFGTAYLQYRDARGEEAVKAPHNFVAQALAEYGLPGGLCYLAILVAMIVPAFTPSLLTSRNRKGVGIPTCDWECPLPYSRGSSEYIQQLVVLPAALLLARSYFAGAAWNGWVWILDALMPAMVLAVMLVAAQWYSRRDADDADLTGARIALGGGIAAFVLYEVISFNLQMPSAAAVFFLAVGALLGQEGERTSSQSESKVPCFRIRKHGVSDMLPRTEAWHPAWHLAWPMAAAATVAAIVLLWLPVHERTGLTVSMERARYHRQWDSLADLAAQATAADPLDPLAAADAAKALGLQLQQEDPNDKNRRQTRQYLERAYRWAQEAVHRDGQNPAWQQLAGTVAWNLDRAEALKHMEQAVRLDPQGLRLRLNYAQMLADASHPADALGQLDAAGTIDRELLPDSSERLTPTEREHVIELRFQCGTPTTSKP